MFNLLSFNIQKLLIRKFVELHNALFPNVTWEGTLEKAMNKLSKEQQNTYYYFMKDFYMYFVMLNTANDPHYFLLTTVSFWTEIMTNEEKLELYLNLIDSLYDLFSEVYYEFQMEMWDNLPALEIEEYLNNLTSFLLNSLKMF
jgi:hypothetical protein